MNTQRLTPLLERRRRKREQLTHRYIQSGFVKYGLSNDHLETVSSPEGVLKNLYTAEKKSPKKTDDLHRKKGILWFLITTVASCLLLYQLASVASEYLRYETETRVTYSEPIYVSMPGVSICFDAFSLINQTKLKEKYSNKSVNELDISKVVSIADIFNMTPSNETIILRCKLKTNDSFALHVKNQEGCYKFYEVTKYQKLQKVCYDIRAQKYWLYFVERVMQGLEEPGKFEAFSLNLNFFRNVSSFSLSVHNHNFRPRGSYLFPSYVSRNGDQYLVITATNRSVVTNGTGSFRSNKTEPKMVIDKSVESSQIFYNSFDFSFAIYCNYFIPPPYPPNCFNYVYNGRKSEGSEYMSQDDCKDSCLNERLKNVSDKLPDDSLITEEDTESGEIDGSKLVFSTSDYKNTTLVKLFTVLQNFCSKICKRNCEDKFYDTQLMDASSSDDFIISIFSYKNLPFYTRYNPKMGFSQFLVQFLSCFGIWLTVDFTTLIDLYNLIDSFFRNRFTRP